MFNALAADVLGCKAVSSDDILSSSTVSPSLRLHFNENSIVLFSAKLNFLVLLVTLERLCCFRFVGAVGGEARKKK